jgi:hypothetical protein
MSPTLRTHSELDPLILRRSGVAFGHPGLDLGRAPQPIDDTTELNEQAVTRRLDQPAVMRGDRRVDQFGADGPEPPESAGFVRANQSGIARDVGCQDRSETAGRGHSSGIPALRSPAK